MELNITELDNGNTTNPYDTFDYNMIDQQNSRNYWEKPAKIENSEKKKKVSFNDILSNMNLVVNKQGVLQFMTQTQPIQNTYYNEEYQNELSQPNNFIHSQQKREPLESPVKHSYIYNKYFKDYADPNYQKPGPRVPKTMEEYHKMLLEDRIKAIEHKKRIEQIKSKKILFTSAPGTQSNPRNVVASKNNLRSMNFR